MDIRKRAAEALRYMAADADAAPELLQKAEDTLTRLAQLVPPRTVLRVFRLEHRDGRIFLPEAEMELPGALAQRMLSGCSHAALTACTLGAVFDTLLRKEQARDMAQAVITDACGSALIEEGCDEAERELARLYPGSFLTDRFSPGYGDLPLEVQERLCAVLDAQRRAGITVGGSFMLNPAKSVTAVIGISDTPQPARIQGCAYCPMRESCRYRKGGERCGF